MVLNLLTLLNIETILKHGLAGMLPVVGWVLAVAAGLAGRADVDL
jgi:hypothetical protein